MTQAITKSAHCKLDQKAPVAEVVEPANYDAIIVGTGTRFGSMSSQMAACLDQAGGRSVVDAADSFPSLAGAVKRLWIDATAQQFRKVLTDKQIAEARFRQQRSVIANEERSASGFNNAFCLERLNHAARVASTDSKHRSELHALDRRPRLTSLRVRRQTGRGEGSSGLGFDRIVNVPDKP